MYINLSPSTLGLDHADFETLVSLASNYGFEGIDFPVQSVSSRTEARNLSRLIEDSGLRWGLFSLPCDFLRVNDEGFKQGIAELQAMLPNVEAAGCQLTYNHIWPGSNERDYEENYAWHIDRIQQLCTCLSPYGVRLGLEFIGPKTLQDTFKFRFIRSARETAALVGSIGDDALGMVVDCFHWYTSGGTFADLRTAVTGKHIINVHVNDATAGRARDEQLDLERQMPLETGTIDASGVLRLIDELGYTGPVIAEPFNPHLARFAKMPPQEVISQVGSSMKALFSAAGLECM